MENSLRSVLCCCSFRATGLVACLHIYVLVTWSLMSQSTLDSKPDMIYMYQIPLLSLYTSALKAWVFYLFPKWGSHFLSVWKSIFYLYADWAAANMPRDLVLVRSRHCFMFYLQSDGGWKPLAFQSVFTVWVWYIKSTKRPLIGDFPPSTASMKCRCFRNAATSSWPLAFGK